MGVIIFDLVGTLVTKEKSDYSSALKWLADTYFESRYKELEKLSLAFKNQYLRDREISHAETSFLRQLFLFEKNLSVSVRETHQAVELEFIKIFRREHLTDGALELLKFLHDSGDSIFILTNSLFSGENLKKYLNTLEIDKYIAKVYSSADIGFRKPSTAAFNFVLNDIGIDNPREVYYVGDSYEKDFVGALESGLTPVLLSASRKVSGLTFDNIRLLLDYFKNFRMAQSRE